MGEDFIAIGNPLGLELTVSNSNSSAVGTPEKDGGNFLQTTAPISHGSSGGPLFNMSGQVIGVNSMFVERRRGSTNFTIPVNDAKALLQRQSAKVQPLPNEVPRDVISKATPKEIPPGTERGTSSP